MKPIQINKKWFIPFLGLVIIFSFVFLYTNQDQKINQQTASAAGWYSYDWPYRTAITIQNEQVTADLTNFPVLISSTNTDWADTSNGGYAEQSDGGDFVFTASDNLTVLPYEIEKYDNTTGQLIAWVKVNSLANLADTTINLYFGNATCDNQWDVAGTWSNGYNNVWHMQEDPTGGTILDTLANNNGTVVGSWVAGDSISAKINKGLNFSGDSDEEVTVDDIDANITTSLTFSAWFKADSTGGAYRIVEGFSPNTLGVSIFIAANQLYYRLGDGVSFASKNFAFSDTASYHLATVTWDGASMHSYIDGVEQVPAVAAAVYGNATVHTLGGRSEDTTQNWDGVLDQATFSNINRADGWIATEYNNQNSPATFYELGATEQGDTTPPTNPTTIHGYDVAAKTNEITDESWDSYDNPYFEFSGAVDNESGVAGYYIYFGTDNGADPVVSGAYQAHVGAAGATQSYTAASLTAGQTYYFRVVTKNNATTNNTSAAATLFTYKYDPTAPSAPEYINVSPVGCSTSTSFTFTWPAATDTGGSNLAGYQYRRGSTGSIESIDALTLSTTSYQEGDNILYVQSIDNAGNVSSWQTSVYCSTATVQVVDGPTVSAGPSSITVDWVSNKATTGYVKVYEGNTYISEQGLTNFSLAHSVKVIGLEPEKAYRYQITWTDQSGNLGETDWYETSTATAPQINNLKVEVLSPTTLNVSWSSTISARFSLEYGIGNYGTIIASGDYLTGYSSKISNLVAGSTYQFRVNATGEDGTKFFAGESVVMPPLPSIGNLRFEPIKDRPDTAVKVSWDTNVELTSSVYYGLKGDSKKEISKSDKVKNHEIVVGELSDNSEYEIYAAGIDQYGNVARSNIQTLRTEYDSRPPKIDNISTESSNVASGKTDTAQITVGYTTDEPAKCFVDYGTGISGSNYTGKTVEDDILQTNHISVISDLVPQAPYHFKIICSDKAGNRSESSDQTVISGEIAPSVFNIILKTLNSLFGWLGRIVN